MRFSGFVVALGLTIVAAVPQAVSAQGKGEVPPFCRDGQGHPQFGRAWCVDHNYPLGNEWTANTQARANQRANQRAWEQRTDWNDVTITPPRQRSISRVGSSQLATILGTNGMRRLQAQAQAAGMTRPLMGSWARDTNGHAVLMVTSGGTRFAEIADTNNDGKVDRVFLLH